MRQCIQKCKQEINHAEMLGSFVYNLPNMRLIVNYIILGKHHYLLQTVEQIFLGAFHSECDHLSKEYNRWRKNTVETERFYPVCQL